jgi:hypothetical protein
LGEAAAWIRWRSRQLREGQPADPRGVNDVLWLQDDLTGVGIFSTPVNSKGT